MQRQLFFIIALVIITSSCGPGANAPLKDHMLAYNWKITNAKHSNVIVTSTFASYVFNFETNDVVQAIRPDSTFIGTWTRSNSSEESPKVLLNFGSHYQLRMLNYDWQQEERTDFVIKFVDNMSAGSSEAVTFEKMP